MTFQQTSDERPDAAADYARLRRGLRGRSLVLVGLMGCGKSTVGRRLASRLELPFVDADAEIERAAGKTIPDIFAAHGEPYFRDGERRVIARLLAEGGHVLATGGGAFMDTTTRALVRARGISVWLKADLDVLMKRVRKRGNRPLLQTPDPEGAMRRLMDERYPVYAEADLTVYSHESPHEVVVDDVIAAVLGHLPDLRAATGKPDDQAKGAGQKKASSDVGGSETSSVRKDSKA